MTWTVHAWEPRWSIVEGAVAYDERGFDKDELTGLSDTSLMLPRELSPTGSSLSISSPPCPTGLSVAGGTATDDVCSEWLTFASEQLTG